jgi:hypothetical protein
MITVETFKCEIKNMRDDLFQELAEINGKRDQLLKDIGRLNTLLALMVEDEDNGKENE